VLQHLVLGGWLPVEGFADACWEMAKPSGSIVIDRCDFSTAFATLYLFAMRDARVRYTNNQHTEMVVSPVFVEVINDSKVVIARNEISTWYGAGIEIVQWDDTAFGIPPYQGNDFRIYGNRIEVEDDGFAGVWYTNRVAGLTHPDQIGVFLNDIHLAMEARLGVGLQNTQGAWIGLNRVSGNAGAGLYLDAASDCVVAYNHLGDLESVVGDIVLSETTNNCYVVANEGDTVVDEGIGNTVLVR
jgi:hypothetical protein